MNPRIKWLLVFSLAAMLVVSAVSYVSFDTGRKASTEKQANMLRTLLGDALDEVSSVAHSGSQLDVVAERLQSSLADNVYFYIYDANHALTHVLGSDDKQRIFSFLNEQSDFGQTQLEGQLYTWVSRSIPGSAAQVYAVYVEKDLSGISYVDKAGPLLAFSLLFVVWLSSWLAMFVSKLIAQLNSQNDVLKYQTMHDSLTGLPNRNMLLGHLKQAIATGKRNKQNHALLFIDLNGFKDINDALGHQYGDDILIQISKILPKVVRGADVVARIDGDEFGVLLSDTDSFGAEIVGRKIIDQLEQSLMIDKEKFFVSACVGITMFPDDGDDITTLAHNADMALALAKRSGINLAFYESDGEEERTELSLVSDLKDAIENDALELYYQPKVELMNQTIVSAEALIRWQHPSLGMLPPFRFIGLAERTGLMGRLSLWVIWRAFRDYTIIKNLGHNISISLNLSVQNLNDPRFVAQVRELVQETKIDPKSFTLEVTESAIVHDAARVSQVLSSLREMGFKVSIDDFGTGYSSFVNFKTLPIDEIKIDRSFVFNAVQNQQDASIIEATINVGKAFGFGVVAEGIEDEATVGLLRRMGCHQGQGFHFAKPMEMERFAYWLAHAPVASNNGLNQQSAI